MKTLMEKYRHLWTWVETLPEATAVIPPSSQARAAGDVAGDGAPCAAGPPCRGLLLFVSFPYPPGLQVYE